MISKLEVNRLYCLHPSESKCYSSSDLSLSIPCWLIGRWNSMTKATHKHLVSLQVKISCDITVHRNIRDYFFTLFIHINIEQH